MCKIYLDYVSTSSNLKFDEKLHYLLDSWMFTMLPAPN